jgi:hypothetical protein
MPSFRDISQLFGMLVAMWPAGYKGARRDIMYLCQCDCGERVPIRNGHLRSSIAKSCGCRSKRGCHGPRTLHGMTRTPELAAYCGAIVRCTKPKALRWKHYGGRGIEFRFKSFAGFFAELGPQTRAEASVFSRPFSQQRRPLRKRKCPLCSCAVAQRSLKSRGKHALRE